MCLIEKKRVNPLLSINNTNLIVQTEWVNRIFRCNSIVWIVLKIK